MPASSRAAQVDIATTPYYHCIARCVRRAFLCGSDPYTGESFEHRKPWLLDRLRVVAEAFAIDVCAYAILSNHFHLVLRVDADGAANLSEEAVLRRYGKIFRGAAANARALPAHIREARVAVMRDRLTDISWFMRSINEHIARKANREDRCTGRFWEGRFKSQPLLDERALLTAMSYVDLNPVRAGMASSLGESDFTSIQQRMSDDVSKAVPLAPLRAEGRKRAGATLPARLDDYINLLEWTGRAAGAKPGGRIRSAPPSLLGDFRIDPGAWVAAMRPGGLKAAATLGAESRMSAEAERRGKRWLRGSRLARALFRAA